jgi:tetratricopeptide (TPR) repeat protein
LAREAKRFDDAALFFELALEVLADDRADVFLGWGLGLVLAERYDDAIAVFQRGLAEQEGRDDPSLAYFLARSLAFAKRYDEGLDVARRAAEIPGASVGMLAQIPWMLYVAKRPDQAEREYAALVERFDDVRDSPDVRDELRTARLVLAALCVERQDLPAAEEWLLQVLDEFPEDIGALNDLGYLWADQGKRLNRSLRMVQQAVADEPDNAAYRDSLGWALHRLGRHQEALVELKQAASGESPDAVILEHLGDVHLALDDVAGAQSAWERSLDAFEALADEAQAHRVRQKLESHAPSP